MTNLRLIDVDTNDQETSKLFNAVQNASGRVTNMMRAMANSPIVLETYLSVNSILSRGALSPELRELLAVNVAQGNQCQYCLSAHTAKGKKLGLDAQAMEAAQFSSAENPKIEAALKFARLLIDKRGSLRDEELKRLRAVGYTDGEIAEIILVTTFNIFPNYFNKIADIDLDFEKVELQS
ncbi:MAG: carboxymuconolactone decarboxylase family protein [Anaerolineales bacterium]|nr:carboxymuconolactone decarboxylase family protein [Anaerolineales bacterium]